MNRCRAWTFTNHQCTRAAVWFLGPLGFCQQHANMIGEDDPYKPYPDIANDAGEPTNGGRMLKLVEGEEWELSPSQE